MTASAPTPAPVRALPRALRPVARRPRLLVAGAAVAALGALAVLNRRQARAAERANPPKGRTATVEGVRLHLIERGPPDGPPVVLLHGNGGMVEDLLSSGLIDRLAGRHRVIAFDRPGHGWSERPRGAPWTPERQSDLLAAALRGMGVEGAVVHGHSWGALVAVALARRHPALARALVLEAGYFFPSPRLDVVAMGAPGVPGVGDLVRHTVAPPLSRLLWPLLMRRIFGPAPVPAKWAGFPRAMALRPSQLGASGAETALMIPAAARARGGYGALTLPVHILAGDGDRMADHRAQSARLHAAVPGSTLRVLPGVGHMVHHTATAAVAEAIEAAAA